MANSAISARWTRRAARAVAPRAGDAGLTLIELIVAFSLMLILSAMALPVARVKVQREKERRLRIALTEIRTAIDRYKDMADAGLLGEQDPDNHGYPESLEALVEGIELAPQGGIEGLGGRGTGMGTLGITESRAPGMRSLSSRSDRSLQESRFGRQGGRDLDRSSSSGLGQPRGLGSSRGLDGGIGGLRGDGLEDDHEGPERIRFLRAIPVDPMTGRREWGMQSVSDSPMARSWNGRNVFDVYSLSTGIALDGSIYDRW